MFDLPTSPYSISVVFKEKKDHRGIVYIQIIVDRKNVIRSTGITCRADHFIKAASDFKYIAKADANHAYKNQQIRLAFDQVDRSVLDVVRMYGSFNYDLAKIAITNKYAKIDTLASYARRYIDTKDLGKGTKKRYEAILRMNILPDYTNTAIVEITPKWLSMFHDRLIKAGYKGTTIWTIFKFIKSVLWMAADSIDFPFPFGSKKGLFRMPVYKNPERHYLSAAQIEQVKLYYNSTDVMIRNAARWFVLQVYLGCRASDLQNFMKHEIKDGRYYLSDVKTKNPHYVPLYPALVEALQAIERPMFSYDKYNKAVKEIGRLMGLPFELTTHCARHSFAVSKLNAHMSSETVMKAMGIKKHSTFAVYGKITDLRVDSEFREKL